jgi:hypothetical protein
MMARKRDNAVIERISKALDLPNYRALARLDDARHECGHLVAASLLGEEIEAVSLGSPGFCGGVCWLRPRSRDVFSLRNHKAGFARLDLEREMVDNEGVES